MQIKNPLALPKITKLVRQRLNYKFLRGAPERSAELNKAHISHTTLVMSERPCLVILSALQKFKLNVFYYS